MLRSSFAMVEITPQFILWGMRWNFVSNGKSAKPSDSHKDFLKRLSSIRHHRLDDLLTYSGLRPRITAQFYSEWLTVVTWNPEQRYIRTRISKKRAQGFLRAAKIILREIY